MPTISHFTYYSILSQIKLYYLEKKLTDFESFLLVFPFSNPIIQAYAQTARFAPEFHTNRAEYKIPRGEIFRLYFFVNVMVIVSSVILSTTKL